MNKKKVIGVDVGGTKTHLALIEDGKVIKKSRILTDAYGTQDAVLDDLKNEIGKLLDDSVQGIGIGVPGLVDRESGVVFNVMNIPAWKNVPVKSILEQHFGITVEVGNDANSFALGEKHYGKAKPFSNVVCICLGTGVGAGVFVNGNLYTGNQSIAGEFCGIRYLDADFETYCSGKFFNQIYGHDALYFAKMAENGNANAKELFHKFGYNVGQLIQTVLFSYGPQAIILGGSLSKSFSIFKTGMQESLATFPHKNVLNSTMIDVSDNDDIPVLGAATLLNI